MIIKIDLEDLVARIGDRLKAESLYYRLLDDEDRVVEAAVDELIARGVVDVSVYHCPCGSCDPEPMIELRHRDV